jgi:pyruvate dehydrogenase E1 component
MFGFQRVGDFIWAAGDMRARGFLMGATAGRTTLAGEGLQHQDGHSQLVATTIPNCRAYDPTYAYELAVIIQDGMQRMYVQNESVFYYISVMNENYPQPALPAGAEAGIIKGGYLLKSADRGELRATLLGSGTILRECIAAAELLEQQFGVMTDVFSITSFSELRREALECARWNLLHPAEAPRVPYVQTLLAGRDGALVAATDYVRNVPDQIRSWVPQPYLTLGTDGFGRSDARAELRQHFEVDRNFIALAALRLLADAKRIDRKTVIGAVSKLGIDANKADPLNS